MPIPRHFGYHLLSARHVSALLPWLVVTSVSCSNPNANAPVVIATQVSPATVQIGDTVNIITTVFVGGLAQASVETNTCDIPFEVLDSSGQIVGPGLATPCPIESNPIAVPAGGQYALQGFWTGLSSQFTVGNPVYVQAGNYRIRGKAKVLELSSVVRGSLVGVTLTGSK